MGRSVYRPRDTEVVCFRHMYTEDKEGYEDYEYYDFLFEELIEDIRNFSEKWGFEETDRWVGQEGHIVAVSPSCGDKTYNIGIAEYCGLMAIWIGYEFSDDDDEEEEEPWKTDLEMEALKADFRSRFNELEMVGQLSNGEEVFIRAR